MQSYGNLSEKQIGWDDFFDNYLYISSIKVSPKQYNIPYKAYACLILKKN